MGKKLSISSARDRVVTRSQSIAMEREKQLKRSSPNPVVAVEPEGMVKRMRRDIKPIHSCSSPHSTFLTAHSSASSSASPSSCWFVLFLFCLSILLSLLVGNFSFDLSFARKNVSACRCECLCVFLSIVIMRKFKFDFRKVISVT